MKEECTKEALARLLSIAEGALAAALPAEGARPAELSAAVRHATLGGGKRVRPIICLASCVAAGGKAEDAAHPAAAIELLHSYTLVHDDLPAMDDDTERRGLPTVWKKYGEAQAILAGDVLQALAFAEAAKTPRNPAAVTAALAKAACGVVQGQAEDIDENAAKDAAFVYAHKTADLFIAAAVMGGLAAGAPADTIVKLEAFALDLGLAFQYQDDLLDGDGLLPKEETERLAAEKTASALAALDGMPGDAAPLRAIAASLLGRKA